MQIASRRGRKPDSSLQQQQIETGHVRATICVLWKQRMLPLIERCRVAALSRLCPRLLHVSSRRYGSRYRNTYPAVRTLAD